MQTFIKLLKSSSVSLGPFKKVSSIGQVWKSTHSLNWFNTCRPLIHPQNTAFYNKDDMRQIVALELWF